MHPFPWLETGLPTFRRCILALLYLAALFGTGCEGLWTGPSQKMYPLVFLDDADRPSLIRATEHQLNYLNRLRPETVVTIEGDTYTVDWLAQSLRLFLDIIKRSPPETDLDRILHEKFTIYQAGGRANSPAGEMLITGYYLPLCAGSLVKKPPYLYPLYATPSSLQVRNDPHNGKSTIGRLDSKGNLIPFWTREEIEEMNLLAGNELVYLQDPVEAFFLQIQGSGLIRLPDGSIRGVHISGSNGREYKSIGKLLVDEQKIGKEGASMQTIKRYLRDHPHEQKRILHHNSKFVIFKWDKKEAEGSIGETLTPGRSIAIDREALTVAAVGYLVSRRPIVDQTGAVTGWEPLRRFVLPQDSGAAIKGTGRADFFWGNGQYAEAVAGQMKEKGQLYFLVKKRL
jgi:membrane-bound lytic murein transglycosylase A